MSDEDKELEAENKRIGAVKRASARAAKPEKDDDDELEVEPKGNADEIEVGGAKGDDDDDDEEPRPSRRERRANRYREADDRARAAEERAERLEAQMGQLTQSLAQRLPVQQPTTPQAHPLEKEIDEVYEQRKQLSQAFSARQRAKDFTQDEFNDFERKARALEAKQMELVARKAAPPPQQQLSPEAAHIRATYHDVLSRQGGAQYAQGEFQRRMALNPGANQMEVMHASFAEARKAFRLPTPGGSTNTGNGGGSSRQAARYGAQPRGGGGGESGGGSKVVKMTPERKKMADAAFGHITDEKKRHRLWAEKVGVKLES